MILVISITAKKEDTDAMSYALQLIEKGNTSKLPKRRAVHPNLTSTYRTRKYPTISKTLPTSLHLFMVIIAHIHSNGRLKL